MNGAVPWYQSRSVMGAIAAIIMTIATQFHLLPASVTQDQIVSFLLMAIPMAVALEGRLSATKQVVATPGKAAAINGSASGSRWADWLDSVQVALPTHLSAPPAPADPPKASAVISMENTPMSVSTILVAIETDALDVLKAAGKAFETFIITEGQKLVAEVKQTYVGTVALNVVQALESQTMTGEQKLETVVSAVVPLITKLVASGGISGAIASVESFALEFAQSVYNDFKADVAKIAAPVAAAA